MVWGDIMTSFWPMCVITSAIARFIPIFKLEYFWNAKTYRGEILIWCHIDSVLSEKPQDTHNLNCLFFNGCLGWKFKNCWNDWHMQVPNRTGQGVRRSKHRLLVSSHIHYNVLWKPPEIWNLAIRSKLVIGPVRSNFPCSWFQCSSLIIMQTCRFMNFYLRWSNNINEMLSKIWIQMGRGWERIWLTACVQNWRGQFCEDRTNGASHW